MKMCTAKGNFMARVVVITKFMFCYAGNGTQQLLSIPVSLAAGGGSSIQILTTSNGQLIATNLANQLTQPLGLAQTTRKYFKLILSSSQKSKSK